MTQLSNWATKYRPKAFDEVIGQGLTIQILENQIAKNEVMPAYLFIGGQGSGKTTTARLLASALDAEVIEIDAASNNGVDNIRQISEQASYKSIHAKKKVYIVDECFSGDTLISTNKKSKRIDEIVIGDSVATMTGINRVSNIFTNTVLTSDLCCVTINSVNTMTTVDHLYFTNNGWVKAKDLQKGDIVYDYASMRNMWSELSKCTEEKNMLKFLSKSSCEKQQYKESYREIENYPLRDMRENIKNTAIEYQQNLQYGLQKQTNSFNSIKIFRNRKRQGITTEQLCTNDKKQPISQSINCSKNAKHQRKKGDTASMAGDSRRKRSVYSAPTNAIPESWKSLGNRVCNTYQNGERFGIPYIVQSRPSISREKDSDRGGWQRASLEKSIIERRKKDEISSQSRVDGIAIYERTNPQRCFTSRYTDSELCGEFINLYDIEVENDPTYFADGILVHNCHMLSKAGSNAFLKTLEDCPADVHFILCTTDPQKILPTVKSRCQIFEFKRPNFEDIESRLSMILRLEDIGGNWNNPHLPDYPLFMIAEKADYGVRDSIKIMQSCVVENSLDCHNVAIKLNIAYERVIKKILKALVEKDVKALTIHLDQCAESDFRYMLKQLLERYSDYVIQNKENNSPEVWRSLYKIYIDLKDVENVNLIIMGALICLIK